eukprot:TRINITY_DN59806_c0_g1_i1.p2 TRINITY_DN59806_c0_g1~~TRINITY_DN59806_c0_g1_i1.p2  ORF type:complete len:192 (+),score=36.89 TRINITY_DN59806_c0_g1_i1:64-639(+)
MCSLRPVCLARVCRTTSQRSIGVTQSLRVFQLARTLQARSPLLPSSSRFFAMASSASSPPSGDASTSLEDLFRLERWAVVGRSSNPIVQQLLAHLAARGKQVMQVDPSGTSEDVCKSLGELTSDNGEAQWTPDVVNLCIGSKHGLKIVEEGAALGVRNVFVQPGAGSAEIEKRSGDLGMGLVNGCVLVQMP